MTDLTDGYGTKADGVDISAAPAFVQHQNLYFAPVLRHRLSFAVLVRRALHQLATTQPWNPLVDLVAVTLPPSLAPHLVKAIDHFPRPSIILAKVERNGFKEVFAATPNCPLVEAARTAHEMGWPIEYLDLEVLPGNLARGPCMRDSNWPDESLIRVLGADRYLTMIEGYFSLPPARLEPLDTWREIMISERLRRHQALWRRILVVCDAGMVRPVVRRLRDSASLFIPDAAPARPAGFKYDTVSNLRLDVLLYYLGDYPRLVERYERTRSGAASEYAADWRPHGRADSEHLRSFRFTEFDEVSELWSLVLECANRANDLRFSTRQYHTLTAFVKNLLYTTRRMIPSPDLLYAAAKSCMGGSFAERLHCYLVSYGSLIKAERVEQRRADGGTTFVYELEIDAHSRGYWPRTCDPGRPPYATVRPRVEVQDPDERTGRSIYSWLPEDQFLRSAYRKLQGIAATAEPERKTSDYRGSTEMGIDIRRTLRRSVDGVPRLSVKRYVKIPRPVSTLYEPHVWILTEDLGGRVMFNSGSIGVRTKSKYSVSDRDDYFVGDIDIYANRPFDVGEELDELDVWDTFSQVDPQSSSPLYFAQRCGWLNFAFDFPDEAAARDAYGADFKSRVPNHADFEHPCGCVHRDLVAIAKRPGRWADIALLTALKYARTCVVVVAPPGFVPSNFVRTHPLAAGKRFVFYSLNHFSRAEREKLGVNYLYIAEKGSADDSEAAMALVMKRYWQ